MCECYKRAYAHHRVVFHSLVPRNEIQRKQQVCVCVRGCPVCARARAYAPGGVTGTTQTDDDTSATSPATDIRNARVSCCVLGFYVLRSTLTRCLLHQFNLNQSIQQQQPQQPEAPGAVVCCVPYLILVGGALTLTYVCKGH